MATFAFTRKLVSTAAVTGLAIGLVGTFGHPQTASAADSFSAPSHHTSTIMWGPGELHEYTIHKSTAQIVEISGLKMETDQVELKDGHEVEYEVRAGR